MNCALVIGRAGSSGFPGKNLLNVLGRPLAAYPMIAARDSKLIDRIFLSTDCDELRGLGEEYGAEFIERPEYLATKEALGEDAYKHGYEVIKERLLADGRELETLTLLMCNAATISAELIDNGIELLRANPEADSAVSVSVYNMWSPLRARKKGDDGFLEPFVPFEAFEDVNRFNCDRDSQGDVFFADMGVSIVRPRCLESIETGLLPQKWMGKKILPIKNWGGLDLDYAWQIGMVEFWLREHGFHYADMKTQ
jgi:hypothetical protein